MSDQCEPMRGSCVLAQLSWQVFHGALRIKSKTQRMWCNCVVTVWASEQCQCNNLLIILDDRQIGDGWRITSYPVDWISLACGGFADMMNALLNPADDVPKKKLNQKKLYFVFVLFIILQKKNCVEPSAKTFCVNCQIKINLLISLSWISYF